MKRRLKVCPNVLKLYRETVRGNENATLEEVELKFIRNAKLADRFDRENGKEGDYYVYGSLHFAVDKHGTVVYMRNHQGKGNWKKAEYKRQQLNRSLKINTLVKERLQ